jgi:hypothetical protein
VNLPRDGGRYGFLDFNRNFNSDSYLGIRICSVFTVILTLCKPLLFQIAEHAFCFSMMLYILNKRKSRVFDGWDILVRAMHIFAPCMGSLCEFITKICHLLLFMKFPIDLKMQRFMQANLVGTALGLITLVCAWHWKRILQRFTPQIFFYFSYCNNFTKMPLHQ